MSEELKFPGVWYCPDSKIRLNDKPPFKFKCDGMELTDAGVRELHRELMRLYVRRN